MAVHITFNKISSKNNGFKHNTQRCVLSIAQFCPLFGHFRSLKLFCETYDLYYLIKLQYTTSQSGKKLRRLSLEN